MDVHTKKIGRKKIVLFLSLFFVILFIVFVKVYMVTSKNVVIGTEQLSENLTDFQIIGKEIVSLSGDPNIYYELSDEKNLNCINIVINSMNVAKTQAQVFYKNNNEGFTEEKSVALILEKGDNCVNIPASYNQLRLDLTNEKGVSIQIEKVTLMRSEERIVDCLLEIIFWGILCFLLIQGVAIGAKKINLVKESNKYYKIFRCSIVLLLICLVSLILSEIFLCSKYHLHFWETNKSIVLIPTLYLLVVIIESYLGAFGVDYKMVFEFAFNKRWWIALVVLLYLVANRLNGDSLAMYDAYIQPGMGNENVQPIVGSPRAIRSDEWITEAENRLSSKYSSYYQPYNTITRGTETLKAPTGGIYLSYSTIGAKPFQFAWAVLDMEYAYSFYWYAPIILSFMVAIEFFLILSKNNKILSLAGAFLVIGSSFYMWWIFPSVLLGVHASFVCIYHFFHCDKIKNKIALGIGVAVSTSYFILILYPAWQVPMGYLMLALLVAFLHEHWEKIKKLSWKDYVIIGCCFVFMLSMVLSYLWEISDYIEIIGKTVYPGARFETGGEGLEKLFYYFQAPLYAYKDIGNASEAGVFFSLFPIPMLMAFYLWVKGKCKEWYTGSLLVATIILTLFAIVPFPRIIAKITMLSNVTNGRLLDMIGLAQIYFMILIFSRLDVEKKLSPFYGIIAGVICAVVAGIISVKAYPGYLNKTYCIVMFLIILFLAYCLVSGKSVKIKQYFSCVCIVLSIITCIFIRPISIGLDAIYSKPAAHAIENIVEKDKEGKWISASFVESAYLVMCGAKTVNSVNIYPNLELWSQLDPDGIYVDVYNRFAHISTNFTEQETSFELLGPDSIMLNLSYKDISKTGVKYLFQTKPLNVLETSYANFELLYNEGNVYIYKINSCGA